MRKSFSEKSQTPHCLAGFNTCTAISTFTIQIKAQFGKGRWEKGSNTRKICKEEVASQSRNKNICQHYDLFYPRIKQDKRTVCVYVEEGVNKELRKKKLWAPIVLLVFAG